MQSDMGKTGDLVFAFMHKAVKVQERSEKGGESGHSRYSL